MAQFLSRARIGAGFLAGRMRSRLGKGDYFRPLPPYETLEPAETIPVPVGFHEPAQLDRITACGFGRTIESEIAKLEQREITETPLRFFDLGEAQFMGACALRPEAGHWMGPAKLADLRGPLVEDDEVHVVSSRLGLKYFGHWLRDDCSAAEAIARERTCYAFKRNAHWPDVDLYGGLFDLTLPKVKLIRARRLYYYEDIGFSRGKAARWGALRARLRAAIPTQAPGRIVFIDRGTRGERRAIANADALRAALEAEGVHYVQPEGGSEAMLSALMQADIAIAVEGSHVTHALYTLADLGGLVVLNPPQRFYNPHHEWARLQNVTYGTVVGTPAEDGFTIDAGEVLSMVERVSAEMTRRRAAA